MKKSIFALLVLALLGLGALVPAWAQAASGTRTANADDMDKLTGVVWKWTKTLYNDGSTVTPTDPNRYLIHFTADGTMGITADCNHIGGTYTVDGNQLTMTMGPSTLVACPPDSQADEYTRQLGNVVSYLFNGDNLVLEFKFDSGTMTFAPSAPTGIVGTQWDVISYNNGKQAVVTLLADSSITLNFSTDGRVSGNSGCNNYFGGYESSSGTLKIGGVASTFKLCHKPDGVMVQEAQYLKALTSAATYEIAGDTLTIRDGGGAMQVVAKQSAAAAGLVGTHWAVNSINNGREAVVGLVAGTEITLNFGADGIVSGNSGCNNYTGGYETASGTLKVGPLASTRRACIAPEGINEQETQYLAALQNSATYTIDGTTLNIRDVNGATQVIATRVEPITLTNTKWNVTGVNNGKQALVSLVIGTEISLNFGADGGISGDAGCNVYGGSFETTADTLKVGPLISTQRVCETPAGVMEQERQYLAALQNSATYTIEGRTLTIRDASGAMQVTALRSEPVALSGTSWNVVNYNNGKEAVVSLLADTKITLDFGTDGRVSGISGCNNYTGSFESTADTLKVGALASTLKLCPEPEGVMEQEAQYLAALQNSATFDVSGGTLTIRDAGGAMQVVATR